MTVSPEIQKTIVKEYQKGVRGRGEKALAKKFGISRGAVRSVLERSKSGEIENNAHNSGRRKSLTPNQMKKLWAHLDKHPAATNEQLAKVAGKKNCTSNC